MRFGLGLALSLPRRRRAGGGTTPPPATADLLREDGFALLREDGGTFILE